MGKLNIKVPVAKLLEGLEKALDERKKFLADEPKRKAKYEKDMAVYNKAVLALVKSGKATLKEANVNRWYNNNDKTRSVNAEFVVPMSLLPTEPEMEQRNEWVVKNEIEELGNAIKLLRMSSDEFVSTSTYKSVVQYL